MVWKLACSYEGLFSVRLLVLTQGTYARHAVVDLAIEDMTRVPLVPDCLSIGSRGVVLSCAKS
jgi:hypothetical protein